MEIGKPADFRLDRDLFKTRDEKRLDEITKQAEAQAEVVQHVRETVKRDHLDDTKLEAKALKSVGRELPTAVEARTAPSGEASALKALELRP